MSSKSVHLVRWSPWKHREIPMSKEWRGVGLRVFDLLLAFRTNLRLETPPLLNILTVFIALHNTAVVVDLGPPAFLLFQLMPIDSQRVRARCLPLPPISRVVIFMEIYKCYHTYIHTYMCVCIYIYIYRERERESMYACMYVRLIGTTVSNCIDRRCIYLRVCTHASFT